MLKRKGFQPLIGEVITGLVLALFGLVVLSGPLDTFAQFGILMIMLLAGLLTDFTGFMEEKKTSILVGAMGVIASFAIIFLPLYFLFHFTIWASLFIAAILSNTAIEICASVLKDAHVSVRFKSVVMGASFVDDIIAVFLIGIVSTMVFTNLSAKPITTEFDYDFEDGPDEWLFDTGSDFCSDQFVIEIDHQDSVLTYEVHAIEDNSTFWILKKHTYSGSEDTEKTLQKVSFSIELDAPFEEEFWFYYGQDAPTNFSGFEVGTTSGLLSELEIERDIDAGEELEVYTAIGVILPKGNHTLRIEEIVIEMEVKELVEDSGIMGSMLVQFAWVSVLIVVFIVVSLTLFTRVIDILFDRVIGQGRFVLLTATFLIAFAVALLARAVGLHEVIGVYIAGLIIGKAGAKVTPMLHRRIAFHELVDDIDPPLRSIFSPIFFGYIGVTLGTALVYVWGDFSLVSFGILIAVLGILAFGGKIIGCGLTAKFSGFDKREASLLGIAMCGRGALEFVLLAFGLSSGIIDNMQFSALVVVTLLTVVLTPFIFTIAKNHFSKTE